MGWFSRCTHKGWRAAFGFCTVIVMGAFALTVYAGCAGDCMTCHPKLKDSVEHLSLKTCINCHKPTTQKIFEFGGGSTEECGNDCFQCHIQWPKDGSHAPLETCQKCHKK